MADNEDLKLLKLPTSFFPAPPHPEVKRTDSRLIVIAYEHSKDSDALISKCIRLGFIRPSDDIRILHILNQSNMRTIFSDAFTPSTGYDAASAIYDKAESESNLMHRVAETLIWEIIRVLRKHGFEKVTSEVMRGDPKLSMVDYCNAVQPSYMLTGTRGYGFIKRTLLGSVSDYLVKHCPCPVLIVKLTEDDLQAREALEKTKDSNFSQLMATLAESA
ncbi:uncharacterized protein BYT42DRAFT_547875 [Radiomyces spectabilis]|uniref:uncharacterized protein n=1 Tax=Radiomyces spectabilis TaxID=64574 RepID=UPI00221EDEC4|nr:uncharacterized protein BYT42DRAFT_547875 [Radiomyces spectabilis]KAI8372831.1 hypothetical protein BYT42DRAFT_547875 [Radiomyces spectabilis]